MSYLVKAQPLEEGYQMIVSPRNAELNYLEFGRALLTHSELAEDTGNQELAIAVFRGRCRVEVEGPRSVRWEGIGRPDPFGKPAHIYLPPGCSYKMIPEAPPVEAAIFRCPAVSQAPPSLITPDQAPAAEAGEGNWRRLVWTSIGQNLPACRLLVGETENPPGNWSSYPPHKHDTLAPPEAPCEEIYFFHLKPSQGFGLMRHYTAPDHPQPIDQVYLLEDGDLVVLPRGYHPLVAAPGYQLRYFWGMAGASRRHGAWSVDPAHAWVRPAGV